MSFRISPAVSRFLLSMAIGAVVGVIISEVSFRLTRSAGRDTPQRIELIIPAGTAQKVAAGQQVPSLPAKMEFIQGDVLVVINQDSVSHQLGPVWVPPGSKASLTLDESNYFSYECSFQPTRFLGLDVRTPTTMSVRLLGMITVAIPSGVLIWLYGLAAFPLSARVVQGQL